MSLVVFILLVLVVLALAMYAVNLLPMIDGTIKSIIMALFVVVAIVVIVDRWGGVALLR